MKHSNRIHIIGLLLGLLLGYLPSTAQIGIPFFKNFSVEDYHAHNRNFDVVCDSAGIAYFANFEGIIYYNGAEWNKILTPGISRITRLHRDLHNQIWAGGHNFIGKIIASDNGTPSLLAYISDEQDGEQSTRIGEVLHIEEKGKLLIFHTPAYRISIQQDSIFEIAAEQWKGKEELPHQSIQLTPALSVRTNGINGLSFIHNDNKTLFTITEENGLCSNAINGIYTDQAGTIWGATDNGLFSINTPSFFTRFTPNEGLKGEVVAIHRHKQQLYVGTLHGLYLYNSDKDQFDILPSITQSCWQLKENKGGQLYAVTSNGLFQVAGNRLKQLTDNNTFSLTFDPQNPKVFYTGEIDGIYKWENDQKTPVADIEKVMKLEFANQHLWAETLYGEIYRFEAKDQQPVLLDSQYGMPATGGNKLYKEGENITLLSRYGFHLWDKSQKKIVEQQNAMQALVHKGNWWPGIATSNDKQTWLADGDGKNLLVFNDGTIDSELNHKLHVLKDYTIRTIYLEKGQIAWVGGDFGLIKIDLNNTDDAFTQKANIHIRSILLGSDSVYFGGNNQDIGSDINETNISSVSFKSAQRNFKFKFSSEACRIIKGPQYAYYLKGYEQQWSPWQENTEKEYTNLSYGTYTFYVKAMDAFGRESEVKSFSFIIEKPFYLEWYSWIIYIAMGILLIIQFFRWRTRQLLQEKQRLEAIVEKRTRQIREQRDEISEKSEKLEKTLLELNQAQDQLIRQEKVAMVGKLTQGLIDRILNPLNYIINFSHLSSALLKDMKEDIEDEEGNITEDNYEDMQEILGMMRTHLGKIEEHGNNTSRILKAMEEMLSDHSCHLTPADLNKLCESNLNVLKEYYKKEIKELSIEVIFKPLPETAETGVDQVQLGRALLSMMQNCIYALQKKKTKVEYMPQMTVYLERDEHSIFIHLRDNGIGIEASILDKIFDPFFTTKTTSEGAGVGLYLSREIVLSHQGNIHVKSVKDEYTEFILELPIQESIKLKENE